MAIDKSKKKVDLPTLSDYDKNTTLLRHIHNPEATVLWEKAVAAARENRYIANAKLCTHPLSGVRQFVDEELDKDRKGRPTNLFQCDICGSYLALVDPHGRRGADG